MVKDHSDSERGNPLLPHRLLFPINSKGSRQDSTYHSLCYTSRGALAGTRNSSMGPPHKGSMRRPIATWANTLTTELHLAPRMFNDTPARKTDRLLGADTSRRENKAKRKSLVTWQEQDMVDDSIYSVGRFRPHHFREGITQMWEVGLRYEQTKMFALMTYFVSELILEFLGVAGGVGSGCGRFTLLLRLWKQKHQQSISNNWAGFVY